MVAFKFDMAYYRKSVTASVFDGGRNKQCCRSKLTVYVLPNPKSIRETTEHGGQYEGLPAEYAVRVWQH